MAKNVIYFPFFPLEDNKFWGFERKKFLICPKNSLRFRAILHVYWYFIWNWFSLHFGRLRWNMRGAERKQCSWRAVSCEISQWFHFTRSDAVSIIHFHDKYVHWRKTSRIYKKCFCMKVPHNFMLFYFTCILSSSFITCYFFSSRVTLFFLTIRLPACLFAFFLWTVCPCSCILDWWI